MERDPPPMKGVQGCVMYQLSDRITLGSGSACARSKLVGRSEVIRILVQILSCIQKC